jgi:energy-coupling factor transporter ATP-binding protein EcfA2
LVGPLRRVTAAQIESAEAVFNGRTTPQLLERRGQRFPTPRESRGLRAPTVHGIEIRDFRGIGDLRLRFRAEPGAGSWTVLLGENGTGKTTVLQALAVGLAPHGLSGTPESKIRDLLPFRRGTGSVLLDLGDLGEQRVELKRDGLHTRDGTCADSVVAGYGATRLPQRGRRPARSQVAVTNLFDASKPLPSPGPWIRSLKHHAFDEVARGLKRLLDLKPGQDLDRSISGELELIQGRRRIPLAYFSNGYATVARLALDLMEVVTTRWGSLEASEGLVLIDELGEHLHPQWQMKITGALRRTFPRMQFIASTHHPLCLRGLRDGEVIVLRDSPRAETFAVTDLPPVAGLSVNQLLTSEHFGLSSTVDPEIEALFKNYQDLMVRQGDLPADEANELRDLRTRLNELRQLGNTMRERLAFEAADRFLGSERHVSSDAERRPLKESTRRLIAEIWQKPLAEDATP